MWLITLLILAVIAYFLVKFLIGKVSNPDSSASQAPVLQNAIPAETIEASTVTKISTSSHQENSALSDMGVDTGDLQSDIQEMIKILNLAPSDASRLSLSREAFSSLRSGDTRNAPSAEELSVSAAKLRQMLA